MKQLKIKKVDKRSNFLQVVAELDRETYEGILMSKGKKDMKNEKGTQDLDSN